MSHIRTTRLDPVVGADRDVELLFRVPVEISEQQIDAAVLVVIPAFVGTGDARSAFTDRI